VLLFRKRGATRSLFPSTDQLKEHPAITIERDAAQMYLRLAQQFG
jgi:hypothetical protein